MRRWICKKPSHKARNKNAPATAQLLSRYHLEASSLNAVTAGASTMSSRTMYSEASRRMASHGLVQTQKLWKPSMGIKFSLALEPPSPPPLYPVLDFRRFFHSSETVASTQHVSVETQSMIQSPVAETVAFSKRPSDMVSSAQPATELKPVCEEQTPEASPACAEPTASPSISSESDPASAEPPFTSLEFQMSRDELREALAQPEDSPGSFWSHSMYRRTAADGTTHDVKVHYCTNEQAMERVCRECFVGQPVLGFDLEWMHWAKRNSPTRINISLIQLASPGCIGLFHVALFPRGSRLVTPTFRAIMEDETVRKAGVWILGDCTRLQTHLGVQPRGVFELSHLYKLVKHAPDKQRWKLINKRFVPLARQVGELLKLPLYKGDDVRTSDWCQPLNAKQISYSASDAYAAIQLYHVLEEKRLAMNPPPDRPQHAELGLPIPLPRTLSVPDAEAQHGSEPCSVESMSTSTHVRRQTEWSAEENLLTEAVVAMQKTTIVRAASATVKKKTTKRSAKTKLSSSTPPRDARIVAAEAKVEEHRAAAAAPGGPPLVARSALRPFFLWRANEDLSPADVAALLRDPPLQIGTVVGYIMQALAADEALEFSRERLRKEVLSLLHPALASGRFRDVVKRCETE